VGGGAGSGGVGRTLIGAALGLGLAVVLCWGLYRRVLKINLTRFFTITAIGLIVVAAGVVGEGVRDLQEGRVLPGGHAYAVDLVGIINPGSWYATLMAGVLNLTPQMTWLQVLSYAGYLVIVTVLFVRAVRTPATSPPDAVSEHPPNPPALAPQAAQAQAHAPQAQAPQAQAPQARRPGWVLPVALAAVPAAIATGVIAVAGGRPAEATTIPVSSTSCGYGFTAPDPGRQTFLVRNTASAVAEVYLIDPGSGAVYGEIEGLAPGVTRGLVVTIGSGQYAWRCVVTGADAVTSATVRVATGAADVAIGAVLPVSQSDLAGPLRRYRAYVTTGLTGLAADVRALQGDVHSGDLDAARHGWLTAHQRYARLGAAYGTFAEFDAKINGRADGLPGGVDDPGFTGFGRLEYGLWHGQSAAALTSVVDRLAADVAGLQAAFPGQDFDPADLPLRTHEVLENTLQFELTGDADQGSGTALATAQANLAGTRELLAALRPLLSPRDPALLNRVDAGAARLDSLLASAHSPQRGWTAPARLDPIPRARINGATGQLLEDLAHVPALLEIRTTG
jgi:high-affinity iron transporter